MNSSETDYGSPDYLWDDDENDTHSYDRDPYELDLYEQWLEDLED